MDEKNNNEYPNFKSQAPNSKFQTLTSDRKGITLIALVVTIIVLLILSGVTISTVFSDDGIIKRAQQAKESAEISAYQDRIDMIILNWQLDKSMSDEITLDDLWDRLRDAGIAEDITELEDSPGSNILTTKEGYQFVIETDENNDVKVEYIGKDGQLLPRITIVDQTNTEDSISLEIKVSYLYDGTISYYLYKEGTEEPISSIEKVTDLTANFTGLSKDGIYYIEIVAENDNGPTTKRTDAIVLLETGTITIETGYPIWLGDGTAKIKLTTTSTVGELQYQVTNENGQVVTSWTNYSGEITGLRNGYKVEGRIKYGVVETNNDYIFELKDDIEPNIGIEVGIKTTKSIEVRVTSVNDSESGMPETKQYNYYIKPSSASEYGEAKASSPNTSYTFTDLDAGTAYDIKVTTKDNAENEGKAEKLAESTVAIGGATEGLETGVITATSSWVGDGTATVTLETTSGLTIQYQKNSISDNGWENYTGIITGLVNGNYVAARLTDGKNYGDEATVNIKDDILPEPATGVSSLNSTTMIIGETKTVTVELSDLQSGINASESKWVFNTTNTAIATTDAVWQNANTFASSKNITLQATKDGTYYLHILSTDNAGNKAVTMAGPVTINKPAVSAISLDKQEITLTLGSGSTAAKPTTTLKGTITPANADNIYVNWKTENAQVATVSTTRTESGVEVTITGIGAGTTNITATAVGDQSKTISCPVTVNLPAVSSISLDKQTATLKQGETTTLVATISPDNANQNVTWKTSSAQVATISTEKTTSGTAITVTAVGEGTATITATSEGDINKKVTCTVEVEPLMKADGTFDESTGVNSPKLAKGMRAIYWDGDSWEEPETTDEWYNYDEKRWANALSTDGSFWVWIPRYGYQITSNWHTSSTTGGNINVVFLKNKTNEPAEGSVTWTNASGLNNWNVHPAFTDSPSIGGWSEDAYGLWVAKFEASRNDASSTSAGSGTILQSKPGVVSWRSITVNNIFTTCQNYTLIENSHMMKNSEWGAVAYLAQSKYGKNAEVWINPNTAYRTGQAGTDASASGTTTSTYAYTDTKYGVNASTTGNVYGIYDMRGGSSEYVASYVNNEDISLTYYASRIVSASSHLKNVYEVGTSDTRYNNYAAAASRYGDALWETSTGGYQVTAWFNGISYFPEETEPGFERGEHYGSRYTSIFAFSNATLNEWRETSFRPVGVAL